MIQKIIKIFRVGKFKSFSSINDDLSLKPITLIFGENTNGKSTLTSIFRSLKKGDRRYVVGKKTFGEKNNPEIEILIDRSKKVYNSNTWKESRIEIFDNDFIHRNIFYGDSIDDKQKAGLYDIYIGEEIRNLKAAIIKEKEKQTELENKKNNLIFDNYKYSAHLKFDEFLKINIDDGIDKKIKDLRDQTKQLENIDSLKKLLQISPLKNPFENLKNEFKKTLDVAIEQSIQNHIQRSWKDNHYSKEFLNEGTKLLKNDNRLCVFCGQSLLKPEIKKLIEDYKKFFGNEYEKLKEIIKREGDSFVNLDIEKECLKFQGYGFEIKFDEQNLKIKSKIDEKIKNKQKDLNLDLNLETDADFIILEKELTAISDQIKNLEKTLENTKDISLLRVELDKSEIQKLRYTEENMNLVCEYRNLTKMIEDCKKKIIDQNTELDKAIKDIFELNKKDINIFLAQLGSNFILDELVPKKHMGKLYAHYCQYSFLFDNKYCVNISNKTRADEDEPVDQQNFNNTFSDSDRRLLAFAFFLSKLKNDKNLNEMIVILDDPFSSFDENRKLQTVQVLRDLSNFDGKKPAQIIILTHEKSFLCMCYNEFMKNDIELKGLKIHTSESNGSSLELCNIQEDFIKEDFFRDLEFIKHSAENSTNLDEALRKARPCMEHLLKRKYYFLLKPETIKRKSITEYLKEINSKCLVKQELIDLGLHEKMHDENPIFFII